MSPTLAQLRKGIRGKKIRRSKVGASQEPLYVRVLFTK